MIFDQYESNVKSYCRSFPAVFSKAKGAELIDEGGKRYIDFLSGAGSLNYGHNEPSIMASLIDYLQQGNICHSLDFHTVAKRQFLHSLNELILAPRQLSYVAQFTGPTGTNAVEAAMKLARKITGRQNIVSFTNGFHGVTLGALSAAGNNFYRGAAGVSTNNVTFMPYDGYLGGDYNTIKLLQTYFDDASSGMDLPAAVIVETIQGEGGVNVASQSWLQALAQLCQDNGVLLIVDDIQTGCGRTGSFFSFEQAGIYPDMVTLSKSLSGSGLPMALVLIKPEHDKWAPGEHNGTFRGNNPAFVTANAALQTFWRDNQFMTSVDNKSALLTQRLTQLAENLGTEFQCKGRGMMQAIACPNGEIAGAISQAAFKHGVLVETCGSEGHVLKFLMPLTISEQVMNEGLDIVEHAVETVIQRVTGSSFAVA